MPETAPKSKSTPTLNSLNVSPRSLLFSIGNSPLEKNQGELTKLSFNPAPEKSCFTFVVCSKKKTFTNFFVQHSSAKIPKKKENAQEKWFCLVSHSHQ